MTRPPRSELEGLFGEIAAPRVELLALHDQLVERAEAAAVLDVAYRTMDSPFGSLLLAATEAGLLRVGFESEGFDHVLEALARQVSPRILRAPGRLERAARQLDEYFAGQRRTFDLALDLVLSRGFRRDVLGYLPAIAYGTTRSYGDVAAAVEHPRAARAVGTACATNPLPLVLPCHRVVRSDGALGSYLGGETMKRRLLELEAPS
jgi:methylated-DNA-[protein]-cysteine S-methyltransferase